MTGMHMRRALAAALAGLALTAGAARAEILDAVGRVRVVSGRAPGDRVLLRHPGGRPHEAGPDMLLYAGDELTAEGEATMEAQVRGEAVALGPGARSYRVPEGSRLSFSALDDRYLQPLLHVLVRDKRNPPLYTIARGPGPARARPISPEPLLPPGAQALPPDVASAMVVWRDGPGELVAGANLASSGQHSFARVDLPAGGGVVEARGGGVTLRWTIERRAAPPRPPWQSASVTLSPEQRVVRAVWLLREGPPEWRMFALGELEALHGESFAARQLWAAILAHEPDALD